MRVVEPIAIVGIGCRLPGGVRNPEHLWRLLADGTDAITEVPKDRWDLRSTYHSDPSKPGRMNTRWGGFLNHIDRFDAQFFGISPREAALMDPQQRLLLEVSYEAVEDAGLTVASLFGKPAGVYVGISSFDYGALQLDANDRAGIDAYTTVGGMLCIAANRISYFFNLVGPSLAVDSACSSSLVAVDLACRSIWGGQNELAFAAGVNAMVRPEATIGASKALMLSPDGRCKSFDAGANGFVRAEGVAVIILKPLSRALADRDAIYAVVRATAVNQDGRTAGLTVPNPISQQANMIDGLRLADIPADTVQYIEAHGTGTPVGDPIEAIAIGTVYGKARKPQDRCLVGSVKSNVGHLEAGAGVVGLIKAALCLQHRQIPASLHFNAPNPRIAFDELRLQVPQKLLPWPATDAHPPRAGVNSFGAGGTNAHAILEAPPPASDVAEPNSGTIPERAWLLPISARSASALKELAQSYLTTLRDPGELAQLTLRDICYSAAVKRSHHECRTRFVASNHAELEECLNAFVKDPSSHDANRFGHGVASKPVFVCSGMGQQWWAMGRELTETEPVYRKTMQEISDLFHELTGWSLLDKLGADEANSEIQDIRVSQPAIFALQAGLASLWRSWGVKPAAVLGHSAGEVAASYIAGALSLGDAVRLTFHRSRLLRRTARQGTMLAAGISREQALQLIKGHEHLVSVAAVNGPRSTTLSGDASILSEIDKELNEAGLFSRVVQVDAPFHSSKMEQLETELLVSLRDIRPQPAVIPFFSTVTGTALTGSELDAEHWYRNMRHPVLFREVMTQVIAKEHRTFLEIGAHPVLRYDIAECLNEHSAQGTVLCSLRRGDPDRASLLNSLGRLYCNGADVEWRSLFPANANFIKLPLYPFQSERYWQETEQARQLRLDGPVHPLLGRRVEAPQPTWRVELNTAELDYLKDHRASGATVFPATGYVEMALAAAQQTFGSAQCVLEDLQFSKLFEIEPEVRLSAQIVIETQGEFKVHGRADRSWDEHARGHIRRGAPNAPANADLAHVRQRCRDQIDAEKLYSLLADSGFEYGTSFQGVATVARGEGEALAEIRIPEEILHELTDYYWHPALLDACLQPALATLPAGLSDSAEHKLFVPVGIERVRFYRKPPAHIFSHVRLRDISPAAVKFDIEIFDGQGAAVTGVQGLVCRATTRSAHFANSGLLYEYRWTPTPRPATHRCSSMPSSLDDLAQVLINDGQALWQRFNRARFLTEFQPRARAAAAAYVVRALRELGWEPSTCAQASITEISHQLRVTPQYRALVQLLLKELGTMTTVSGADPERLWSALWNDFPECQAETILIRRCGKNLASVLRGEMDPLGLIFPDNAPISAEHLYQNSASFRPNNLLVQKAIIEIVHRLPSGKALRILEIGGGTGGMTSFVLPILPGHCTEYVFSDISLRFINNAQRKFSQYSTVQYRPLDIGLDPIAQGFVAHSFDLIIASDVLHATRDLRRTVQHVKTLLASGGRLLLLEITRPWLHTLLTFGLLKGWWLFEDHDLRSEGPSLTIQEWTNLLCDSGFSVPICIPDCPEQDSAPHAVFLARGPQLAPEPAIPSDHSTAPKCWVVFADTGIAGRTSTGARLASQLRQRGDRVIEVKRQKDAILIDRDVLSIGPDRPEDFRDLLETIRSQESHLAGIVYLWSFDIESSAAATTDALKATADRACMGVLQLVQAIAATSGLQVDSLWLVTRSAQSFGNQSPELALMQSPVWGLGRVIRNEYPGLHCRLVDLASGRQEEIAFLVDELNAGDDTEDEIGLDGELRYVHRFVPTSPDSTRATDGESTENAAPFRIELQRPGFLDSFSARHLRRAPPESKEIEIEITAAALNFRDLMLAMGMLPPDAIADDPLHGTIGLECAGRVVAVGGEVSEFRPGDEVVSLGATAFASHVTVDAWRAARKPQHLSSEEAATIPAAFMTAFYSLHTLGNLQRGERVLIHSAAGGVGLAAVQLALKAGAIVLATAGSPEKRELLAALGVAHVMDSRTLTFADEVLELTRGEGIDLVLNSLAGDAIEKSLALLRPYGRFIEIGKVDIYRNRTLGMRFLRKNISILSLDLSQFIASRPKIAGMLLREVSRQFEGQELRPLPQHVFAVSHVAEAFQCMAQGRHVGKLLVSMQDRAGLPVPPPAREASIGPDATYLITGGLGGLGLSVADHLARRGARHIALIGRSPPSSSAQRAVQSMRDIGIDVMICQADVARRDQVSHLLAQMQGSMPPLRGVIHAAMVLDDAPIEHLTRERMWKAMAPKMLGAWNLHVLTADVPLDFFILFSSAASMFGNPGQANYIAGNMFLDALAHYRRSHGLPALAINWGAVAEAGHLANNPEACERIARLGIKPIPVSEMLGLLDRLMFSQAACIAVADVDWKTLTRSLTGRIPARLAELAGGTRAEEVDSRSRSDVRAMLEAGETALPALLEKYLRDHVARAMGASAARIDVHQSLLGLGVDSLIAVDVRNRVSGDLGINIPLATFMQGATIRSVAAHIVQRLKERNRGRSGTVDNAEHAGTSKRAGVVGDAHGRAA